MAAKSTRSNSTISLYLGIIAIQTSNAVQKIRCKKKLVILQLKGHFLSNYSPDCIQSLYSSYTYSPHITKRMRAPSKTATRIHHADCIQQIEQFSSSCVLFVAAAAIAFVVVRLNCYFCCFLSLFFTIVFASLYSFHCIGTQCQLQYSDWDTSSISICPAQQKCCWVLVGRCSSRRCSNMSRNEVWH